MQIFREHPSSSLQVHTKLDLNPYMCLQGGKTPIRRISEQKKHFQHW